MKFEVHSVDSGVNPRVHRIGALAVTVQDGAYVFYDVRPTEPKALFPIRSYYVKKEG